LENFARRSIISKLHTVRLTPGTQVLPESVNTHGANLWPSNTFYGFMLIEFWPSYFKSFGARRGAKSDLLPEKKRDAKEQRLCKCAPSL
jgi:hypothetical protein